MGCLLSGFGIKLTTALPCIPYTLSPKSAMESLVLCCCGYISIFCWFLWSIYPYASAYSIWRVYFDGLVQDCSNSSALAMELLRSCAKPLICSHASEVIIRIWVKTSCTKHKNTKGELCAHCLICSGKIPRKMIQMLQTWHYRPLIHLIMWNHICKCHITVWVCLI